MSDLNEYFREQIKRYGDDPRAAGWISRDSQERRFALVAELLGEDEDVLDVGCGPGHLYDYLRERGWRGGYLGIDPLPEMVDLANGGGRPAVVGDLAAFDDGGPAGEGGTGRRFHVVFSSGVVSMQLGSDTTRREWLAQHLRAATERATKAVVVNFLSARSRYPRTWDRWFPRPGDVVDEALAVVRRVTVRHDYYDELDCTLVLHVGDGGDPA